jgi:hypothetical protein
VVRKKDCLAKRNNDMENVFKKSVTNNFLLLMEEVVIGKKGPIGCPQSRGERMQMTILFVCLSHKSGLLKRLPGKKK